MPATSLNVTLFLSRLSMRARDLPKLMAPLPAILIWRMKMKYSRMTNPTNGAVESNRFIQNWLAGWNSSGTL